jgi:hypothetical protein
MSRIQRTLIPLVACLALAESAQSGVSGPITATPQSQLNPPTGQANNDLFGGACDSDGDTAVVGASHYGAGVGAVFVYVYNGTSWGHEATLVPANPHASARFGTSVAIDGDTIVAGTVQQAAYVFTRTGVVWTEQATLTGGGSSFGASVAVSADTAIVSNYSNGGSGLAHIFLRTGTTWQQQGTIERGAVAIDGDTAVTSNTLIGANALVYTRTGTTWSMTGTLTTPDTSVQVTHGAFVDICGDTIVIGEEAHAGGVGNVNRGRVTVFRESGGAWSQEATLVPIDPADSDFFGNAVSLDGDALIIGARGKDLPGTNAGAAYVFTRPNSGWDDWTERAQLQYTGSPSAGDEFGDCVALSGNFALVGATQHDFGGFSDNGSAFVFELATTNGTFCDDSDGSLASCPCANPGDPDTGCDIAQGTGGVGLSIIAQQTTPSNSATLQGTGHSPAPALPTAIVLRSDHLDSGTPVVFGDGLRCVATPLVRIGPAIGMNGVSTHVFNHGAMAGPPGTYFYQLWFRNLPIMFCDPAEAFNLSNGITMTW